jgi:hypothetical protein
MPTNFLDAVERADWQRRIAVVVGARVINPPQIPISPPDHHTILGGAPRDPGGIGARYQGLGRGAAGIDASATDEMALNESHLHPGAGWAECQRWSGLAGADNDRVEVERDTPLQQSEATS